MSVTLSESTANPIVSIDTQFIFDSLSDDEKKRLKGSVILITGCGGFLGYYFMHFFSRFASQLELKKIIALDNFITGSKDWLEHLEKNSNGLIQVNNFNLVSDPLEEISQAHEADFIIHLASIASPSFYRKFPIETVDANVTGLRILLEFFKNKPIKGLLFFSSSEVYGDPLPEFIPTAETYRGNVATIGPRACYDEAKRFGETLCYLFSQKHQLPITIVRPFNNYGPGMGIHDKRLPADFAKAVLAREDLVLYSDGTPTRTFCYVADAMAGYLKALVHGKFDVFNIGIDKPEISVIEFARIFAQAAREVLGYDGKVQMQPPPETDYLTDNPARRCPNIEKARTVLGFKPAITVEEGITSYLRFLHFNNQQL
jgi:UDP-glucuronate decarboxylase